MAHSKPKLKSNGKVLELNVCFIPYSTVLVQAPSVLASESSVFCAYSVCNPHCKVHMLQIFVKKLYVFSVKLNAMRLIKRTLEAFIASGS